jgi:hypothetical protein
VVDSTAPFHCLATQLLDRHPKDLALGELALKIDERRDVGNGCDFRRWLRTHETVRDRP